MSDTHTEFVGSIPETYDAHLGPFFFEHYGADLARRVSVPPDGRVLELACGTGISTEYLRAALPDSVEIVATDLNEPMLDHARQRRGGLANVSFGYADALDLPHEDAAFDAVVCQFGIMFFPDKAAAAAEVWRVLKPGGQFAFNTWDSLERNPAVLSAQRAIARFFASDPPAFLQIPFGYYELEAIEALLRDGGFNDLDTDVVPHEAERPSAHHVATGLVEGNPTIHEIQERATAPAGEIVDAVAEALAAEFGDNPMRTPLSAIVVTARRPAA
jgi:SAM-dependent methyltransferase